MPIPVIGNDVDENCGCGVPPVSVPSPNPLDSIIVRSKAGIQVGNVIYKYQQGGKVIYELDDLDLIKPVVNFVNDQSSVKEVGFNVAVVNFSGDISQGTFPISSKIMTPDEGLDLDLPFNFQKTNVKRTTPGAGQLHTLVVTDDQGNATTVQSSVPFKHAFYMGFNSLAVLDQAAIKALANKNLVDSIAAQWGGSYDYVVPGAPAGAKYIYWCGPVGTPVPVGAILNGLTLPLYFGHANVNVTNIHDGALIIPYWVVRTANRLNPGTYEILFS